MTEAQAQWLIELLKETINDEFVGNIQISSFKGGISNVMINTSVKPPC